MVFKSIRVEKASKLKENEISVSHDLTAMDFLKQTKSGKGWEVTRSWG